MIREMTQLEKWKEARKKEALAFSDVDKEVMRCEREEIEGFSITGGF